MDIRQLEERLTRVEPSAFLVPGWMLRRIVKAVCPATRLELRVPHADVLVTTRAELDAAGVLGDLVRVAGRRDLPDRVVLLTRPDGSLVDGPPEVLLVEIWRLLFHARIDEAFEAAAPAGPAALRARIDAIGQTAFDEIRAVLREENRLLPPRGDLHVLRELTALWLELEAFAPEQLTSTFPALGHPDDLARVGALLAEGLDVARLFRETQPEGAPDPAAARAAPSTVSVASAVPPGPRSVALGARLAAAFGTAGPTAASWSSALAPLESAGDAPSRRVLHELDRVASDHERPVEALSPWAWAFSGGKKPLRRTLPSQRELRMVRHLRAARARAEKVGPGVDVAPLLPLVSRALDVAERDARAHLEPAIGAALDEVGLAPRHVAEGVARDKLVAELADRAIERGYFTMGDIRDGLARGHLKLSDVTQAEQLVEPDALLAADKRLARRLDGVYHRGEIYLRGLQRVSSVAFGTAFGRWLVRFVALPFGGAALALEGLGHMVAPVAGLLGLTAPHLANPILILLLGLVLLGALHLPPFRAALARGARATWRLTRGALWDAPRALYLLPSVQRVLGSPPARLLWGYLCKPLAWAALVSLPLALAGLGPTARLVTAALAFTAATVLFNTPLGRAAELAALDGLARAWLGLRHRFLPGLVRLVLDGFKVLSETVERALQRVEAWLRLARGERRAVLVAKAVLAALWAAFAWVARLYVNLLIEPQVNPIKHFPVVTVAHKIMLPFTPQLTSLFATPFELLGPVIANTIAGATVFLLPGVFGFLAWELLANWRLYEGNRARILRPIPVGSHGETMARFLRPGLHSGTVPKLFARLRRAERQASPRRAAQVRKQLHHVEDAVRAFAERDLVAVLAASGRWSGARPLAGAVHLASNRLCVALGLEGAPEARPVVVAFEEQSGWLVASIADPGWLMASDPASRSLFADALAGFYRLAGVDLVREAIADQLPPGAAWDVADAGLVVWPTGDYADEVVVPLASEQAGVSGRPPSTLPPPLADLRADDLRLDRRPVAWSRWAEVWSTGEPLPGALRLLPLALRAADSRAA